MTRKLPSSPAPPPALSGPAAAPPRPGKPKSLRERMPWLPWVLPLALFLVMTALEGQFAAFYPWFYSVKVVLVSVIIVRLWRFLPEAAPLPNGRGGLILATALGLVLAVLWVVVDLITPHFPKLLGERIGYNPFRELPNAGARGIFLLVRFYGLVVVAPICEELFYRGFLLRFITDFDDFRRVPIGRFSTTAFGIVVALMALSHPEWLSAAVFSAAMCALLARTRSVFACIVCHGVTNAALGVYVLAAHAWRFW